jgi:hypothetical protein
MGISASWLSSDIVIEPDDTIVDSTTSESIPDIIPMVAPEEENIPLIETDTVDITGNEIKVGQEHLLFGGIIPDEAIKMCRRPWMTTHENIISVFLTNSFDRMESLILQLASALTDDHIYLYFADLGVLDSFELRALIGALMTTKATTHGILLGNLTGIDQIAVFITCKDIQICASVNTITVSAVEWRLGGESQSITDAMLNIAQVEEQLADMVIQHGVITAEEYDNIKSNKDIIYLTGNKLKQRLFPENKQITEGETKDETIDGVSGSEPNKSSAGK